MKKVLITGASKGIGKDLVLSFLNDDSLVYGISRSDPGIKHPNFRFIQADLSDSSSLLKLCQQLKKIDIDTFIHAAMYTPKHRPFLRVTSEEMILSYQLAVTSPLEIIKSLYGALKKNMGEIIFIGSEIVNRGSSGQMPYLCAKTALSGLTKGLYHELSKTNIITKTLALTAVETETFLHQVSEEKRQKILKQMPNQSFLTTDTIYRYIRDNEKKDNGEVVTLMP